MRLTLTLTLTPTLTLTLTLSLTLTLTRTHAEFNQWLSALLGAWRDHEHDELRWAPSISSKDGSGDCSGDCSGDQTPAYPGERGHDDVAPGGRGVPAAAAAAESAEHKAKRERAAAELRKRTWAAFASIDEAVPPSVRRSLG